MPNETARTALEQALLWRQSRRIEEIRARIAALRAGRLPS